jgi:proteasome lid subunit RPN8/RPN11
MIDIPPSIPVSHVGMKCRISRFLLNRFAAEAGASRGREICGLLLGEANRITDAVAVPNVANDQALGFVLDSHAHLRIGREARERGLRILGHYHSHPSGNPRPSANDARNAEEPGVLWLIVVGGEQSLWISRAGGTVEGAFDPVVMEVETTALQPRRADANRGRGTTMAPQGR